MRGKQAPKRKIKADSVYGSTVVTKLVNYIMKDGKKSVAEKIIYDCFEKIADKITKGEVDKTVYPTPLDVFDQAVKNVIPAIEVRGRRIGGGNYQIPTPVRGERRYFLAFHWIITAAQNKKGKPMAAKLADELLAALVNEGDAMKKKLDVQRMADANRAFAHFARF